MTRYIHQLFATLVVMVAALGARAEMLTITVQWDNPGAIAIKMNSTSAKFLNIPADATSWTFSIDEDSDELCIPLVYATSDYAITEAYYYPDGGSKKNTVRTYYPYYRLPVLNQWGSDTYANQTVHFATEKIVRDASLTVNIENGAEDIREFTFTGAVRTEYAGKLIDGSQQIAFSSTVEGPGLIVCPRNSATPFYSIKLNGETPSLKAYSSYEYEFDVKDGDVLTIRYYETDPVKDLASVDISFAQSNPECIAQIWDQTSLKSLTLDASGHLDVENGHVLRFTFAPDYTVASMTVNGEPVEVSDEFHSASVKIDGATQIAIDAAPTIYEEITYTAYILNADGVRLRAGNGVSGEDITLPEGTPTTEDIVLKKIVLEDGVIPEFTMPAGDTRVYTFTASSKYEGILVLPAQGYWMRASRDANKEECGSQVLTTTMYIAAQPIAYDTEAVIYLDADLTKYGFRLVPNSTNGATSLSHEITEKGYSTLLFDPEYEVDFTVRATAKSSNPEPEFFTVVLDGTALKKDENGVYSGVKLAQNSVLKILGSDLRSFTSKQISVTGAGVAPAADIVYDKVVKTGLPSEVKQYAGTEYVLTPAQDNVVYIDGAVAAASEDGTVTFTTASKAMNVVVVDASYDCHSPEMIEPHPSEKPSSLARFTLFFPGFTSVAVARENGATLIDNKDGRTMAGTISVADGPEAAARVEFADAPSTAGTYTLSINSGTFMLEGVHLHEGLRHEYTIETDGIIETETVNADSDVIFDLNGVLLNSKWDALPAGTYVRNGQKMHKK